MKEIVHDVISGFMGVNVVCFCFPVVFYLIENIKFNRQKIPHFYRKMTTKIKIEGKKVEAGLLDYYMYLRI